MGADLRDRDQRGQRRALGEVVTVFEALLIAIGGLTAAGAVANTLSAVLRARRDQPARNTVEVTMDGRTLRVEGADEADIAEIVKALVKLQEERREADDRGAGDREAGERDKE
ncbi:effector-associated constant component EACC1 [Micromonospora sp. RB23]